MAQTNNTFGKGINLDIPNYQYQSDTLSYCRNCAFLTGEGNEGILQNMKGNLLKDSLTSNYFPVAIKVYGGIAYIVSAEVENNTFTGRGEVGTFPSPNYENTTLKDGRTLQGSIDYINPTYRPLINYLKEDLDNESEEVLNEKLEVYGTSSSVYSNFNTELFNFTEFTEFDIELQPSYDGSINIIFTDNYNPIRLINTRFTALSNNRFEIRDRVGQDDTNLYNKKNFNNTLNLFQYSNKIVNLDLDTIAFGGQLNSGTYRYYIKYATQDGNTTNIVAESFNVSIFHGSTLSDIKGGDENILTNTRKLIRLKLSNLDTSFSLLKVQYSYSYGDNILSTSYHEIETDYLINGESIIIEHTGRESSFPISRQEIGVDYISAYTAKTITQSGNRLYAANIKSKEYDLVSFEEYAKQIKIGHKQKQIDLPYTSAVVDDNSVYNSTITTKAVSDTNPLTIGFKEGYHNPYNIYYNLPYFNGESYIFSAQFILDDGTVSQCYPLRGIDNYDNDKYNEYGNEALTESNSYFSIVNGENLKGLYRFPPRIASPSFAQLNGDTSYNIMDDSSNFNREVIELGNGKEIKESTELQFDDAITSLNKDTIQQYYLDQIVQGTVVNEETLDGYEDPYDSEFKFVYDIYDSVTCEADPNCTVPDDLQDCINNINCTSYLIHECNYTYSVDDDDFTIEGVNCFTDEYDNVNTSYIMTTSNKVDKYDNPINTTYNYQVSDTKNSKANVLAVTFELPSNIEYPKGTIGIRFLRANETSKDLISQGYIVDTLPVPVIDIYGEEEKGNRFVDYISDFGDGGMKLVPAIDYTLDSSAVWDRQGSTDPGGFFGDLFGTLDSNRKAKRKGEGDNTGLQPILFNSKGWDNTEPYKVRRKFAFISNDLISSSYNVSSDLIGGNFKMFQHSRINLYGSIKTNCREFNGKENQYFSLHKTVSSEEVTYKPYDCNLDFVGGNIEARTPGGFSSTCLFTGTHNGFKYESFVLFPHKFNSYIGVSIDEDIELGDFSTKLDADRLGENLNVESNYGGKTLETYGNIRDAAMLVSLYRDLGFDLGTNEDDLTRLKQSANLEAISYTPITKRMYWEKPIEEVNSISIEDLSEDGKIIAYGGDNYIGLGIRQMSNNLYGVNEEAPDNSFRKGRVGQSISLINDSKYNPLFRTIEVINQAEAPRNYYPNLLSISPNDGGDKYARGNQWRDYEDLESEGFNYGGIKLSTDRNYITIVDRVPYLNTDFSTRVIYSELHINSAIENGYRNFLPSAYRDYSQEHGQITALRSAPTNSNFLIMVQETGIAMLPTNLRSILANQANSTAGSLYFEETGILGSIEQIQQLTKQYGSKWLNSIVVTNGAIYGVDIDNTKIWKLSQGIEFISDMRVRSWLYQLKETYTYKSVNLLNKDIYSYYDLGNNYVHFNFKEVECIDSSQSNVPYAWEVNYTTLQEYNNGLLTGNEKPNVESDPDYVPNEIVEQEDSPCPFVDEPPFPLDVDIFVIWDTTSFNPSIKATLKTNVVYPWLANFRAQYPQWAGNFYEIDAPNTTVGEQWLNWVTYVRAQPSPKAILIAMVDESHNGYHNEDVPGRWAVPGSPDYTGYSLDDANTLFNTALTTIGTTKPQANYIADYKRFLDLYNNYFDYFKGMVYAIPSAPNDLPRLFANFQLHAYAAIEGEVVSDTDFIDSQQGNISIIKDENLYSELGLGLKHYGWQEQHNFAGQATDLSLAKFTEDITPLILQGTEDGFTGWKVKLSSGNCTPLYKIECTKTLPTLTQNLSYSETLGNWNSFWGFFPSKTFNLFNKHYTLDGTFNTDLSNIWEHEVNDTRCNFYGNQDEFVFEFLVTDNIQYQKIFNNFLVLCNEVPPIHIEYVTDNEPTIDNVGVNPIKEPRVQDIYPRFRGRNFNPYNINNEGNPVLNRVVKYNAKYKENHMYIQIDDNNRDTRGRLPNSPYSKVNNSKIRDKYLKVRFRYKGDEYSIIQAVITAYQISFS